MSTPADAEGVSNGRAAAEEPTGNGPSELAEGANTQEAVEMGRKNELAYTEMCGCLDDKMLTLIQYEAPDDGKKSLEILRCHLESEEKSCIVGLYTELTNVLMADVKSWRTI